MHALLVDQVLGRPVLVLVGVPGRVVVVLHDGVFDAELLDRRGDVRGDVLEGELGRVHADDHEPVAVVGGIPGLEVGQRPLAVDARVGPEVDQHDLAAQRGERQRRRVEPATARDQRRCGAVVGQARAAARAGDRRLASVSFASASWAVELPSIRFWSAWV